MSGAVRLSRREALAGLAALAAPAAVGQARPRVVVLGGGAGGASLARLLARGGGIDVTLVEARRRYRTCFFSNHVLGGLGDAASLEFGYGRLAGEGIALVHARAMAINRDAGSLRLGDGSAVAYDRLALAPGIGFVPDALAGWSPDSAAMPHVWAGGDGIAGLAARIDAMPEGGVFAMIAPPNPYRCPPGPYERASMIALRMRSRNPRAKLLIFEPKETFSKQALFEAGWADHYPGMIEVLPDAFTGGVERVDEARMEIAAGGETFAIAAANVIPAQRAAAIVQASGLAGAAGWAEVEPGSMRSLVDPAIFVLGDSAAAGDMPKSAFAANNQAAVVAAAIRGDLLGTDMAPPRYLNTCWSLIAPEDGVRVGAAYAPEGERIAAVPGTPFLSAVGEPAEVRRATWRQSLDWRRAITTAMFG